jgi:hypothetical protein
MGIGGWVLLGMAWLFLGSYVYEQTYLPWKFGPSELPYAGSLLNSRLFLSGLVVLLVCHLWLLTFLGLVTWKRHAFGRATGLAAILLATTLTIAYLPFSLWDWLLIEVSGPGQYGVEYLTRAAGAGDDRLVRSLLRQGVNVNAYDSHGTTALHAAAGGRQERVVQLLLQQKADVLARRDYCAETPLMDAAVAGHGEIVKLLLANGANPKQENCDGATAGDLAKDKTVAALLTTRSVATP